MLSYADNCQGCGKEYLSSELIPIKLGSMILSRIKVCAKCLEKCDPVEEYLEAAKLLLGTHAD